MSEKTKNILLTVILLLVVISIGIGLGYWAYKVTTKINNELNNNGEVQNNSSNNIFHTTVRYNTSPGNL